jgi:hypothetical protein
MKQRVKLNTNLWDVRITPQIFFAKMPYMFKHFEFIQSSNPDFVIYSQNAKVKNIPKGCKRIFYTGENKRPNMKQCDWAFTYDYDEELKHPRHHRLPNYTRLGAGTDLIKPPTHNPAHILKRKTKFCAFINWHHVPFRDKFFVALSKYKHVDAPGRVHNNMPTIGNYPIKDLRKEYEKVFYRANDLKLKFLRPYKFVIAFENNPNCPGYTTEKLYHAMVVNSVPLYWGNPLVHRDFNTKSFVNYHDYNSVDAMIDRIIELDKNADLYMQCVAEPWYPNNKITKYVNPRIIVNKFRQIFRSVK